jgi:sulfate transport system permease protein
LAASPTTAVVEPGAPLVEEQPRTGTAAAPRPRRRRRRPSTGIELGLATAYLSVVVLLPLGAVVWKAGQGGWSSFWDAITTPEARAALQLTVLAALIVALVNAVMGTLIAWLLVRDRFPGKRLLDTLIDLPFALPTIVAGVVLLTLYGPQSPVNVSLAYTEPGVVAALLFVTLPFVVRTVEPVLGELDREMEQAAASLGAGPLTVFRRIVLPNLVPAIAAGTALSFARAISEYGATVLISGNLPFKTEVASVNIYNQIQSDNPGGAAAVSTVLLLLSLAMLIVLGIVQRRMVRRG